MKDFIKNKFRLVKFFFSEGEERTVLIKKNIVYLILMQGLGILISFILVPITIDYVNTEVYGIWLTISSMVAWISLFDIGINNGLRNKLAESLANRDYLTARNYISTTYLLLSFIFIPLFIIFVFVNNYIYWPSVLNCSDSLADELSKVVVIVFGYFCFRFIFSTINIIFLADQKPAMATFVGLIGQIASLIIIYLLTKFSHGSLLNLSFGLCIVPIVILFLMNIIIFSKKFYHLRPSIELYGNKYAKDIFGLGLKFFVIQVAGIIQFQSSNFIIIRMFGADDVTIFNIAHKYFSVITMIMGIVITPLWSAVTNAYYNDDNEWIMNSVKKYQYLGILLFFIGLLMLAFSNQFYKLWIGNTNIQIPFEVSFWMLFLTFTTAFGSIYVGVLNGISALRVQFISTLISPFVFVLSCFIFIEHFKMGVAGIIISSIIGNFNGILLAPLQYYKVFIQKNINPIWNRS